MDAAIAEFFVVNLGFFGAFAGEFLDALEFFAVALGFLDFFEEGFGGFGFAVQVIVECLLDEVRHEAADGGAFGAHVLRAEFCLGLGFKNGFLDLDANGGADGGADIDRIKILFEEILNGLGEGLAEGGEVGAAHGGVLAIDEGVVILAVGVVVGKGDFDVLVLQVGDRVKRFAVEFVFEEIAETVLGFEFFTVVEEGEAAVEVGVVPEHILDVIVAEAALAEDFGVGIEAEFGAGAGVFGCGLVAFVLARDLAAGKLYGAGFAFAKGLNGELGGEGVDGFDANSVEADGFLEGLGIVFRAGVDFGGAVLEFAEGDAAPVVAHVNVGAVDIDLNCFAVPHDEFVDGVVDDFLQENVDAVIGGSAVPEFPDIHTGAEADVRLPVEGFDAVFVVFFGHGNGGSEIIGYSGIRRRSRPGGRIAVGAENVFCFR